MSLYEQRYSIIARMDENNQNDLNEQIKQKQNELRREIEQEKRTLTEYQTQENAEKEWKNKIIASENTIQQIKNEQTENEKNKKELEKDREKAEENYNEVVDKIVKLENELRVLYIEFQNCCTPEQSKIIKQKIEEKQNTIDNVRKKQNEYHQSIAKISKELDETERKIRYNETRRNQEEYNVERGNNELNRIRQKSLQDFQTLEILRTKLAPLQKLLAQEKKNNQELAELQNEWRNAAQKPRKNLLMALYVVKNMENHYYADIKKHKTERGVVEINFW